MTTGYKQPIYAIILPYYILLGICATVSQVEGGVTKSGYTQILTMDSAHAHVLKRDLSLFDLNVKLLTCVTTETIIPFFFLKNH